MSFHMGNGGKVMVASTDVNVGKWQFRKKSRLAEVTNSSTAGWAKWKGTVKEGTGRFEAPWDDASLLAAVGLTEGAEVTLKLYLGDSTKFFTVPAIIEEVGYDNDNTQGVVVYDVTFRINGAITEPTA